MMRLGELRAAVEAVCGGGFSHDSTRHFNSCLRLLAAKSEELSLKTIFVINGEMTIPKYMLTIHSLSFEGQPLTLRNFEPAQLLTPSFGAKPVSWMKIGDKILLHPRPSNVINVDVFFFSRPAMLVNDNDVPELPDADDVLIAYAIWQIKRDEGELQVANEKGNEFYRAEAAWRHLNGKSNPVSKRIAFQLW